MTLTHRSIGLAEKRGYPMNSDVEWLLLDPTSGG